MIDFSFFLLKCNFTTLRDSILVLPSWSGDCGPILFPNEYKLSGFLSGMESLSDVRRLEPSKQEGNLEFIALNCTGFPRSSGCTVLLSW